MQDQKAYSFTPFPELHTERLRLRSLDFQDAPFLKALRAHESVNRFLGRPMPESDDDIAQMIENRVREVKEEQYVFWAITLPEIGELIGTICLWNLEPRNFRCELGYELHPDHQGMGYMGESVRAVLDYAFDHMKMHTVIACTAAENTPSVQMLEKLGFVKEAHYRDSTYFRGRFHDQVVYTKFSMDNGE